MARDTSINRRAFLTGSPPVRHHISSAVIIAPPARVAEVRERLGTMAGVEVHACEGSRLVVTIEGATSGVLGETLSAISLIDGVIAANMVFEHIEEAEANQS